MSTYTDYTICERCGAEYMFEFSTKTGRRERITQCDCDAEISYLEKKLSDEGELNAILTSALEAIAFCTDNEDPRKIAEETLSSIAHRT